MPKNILSCICSIYKQKVLFSHTMNVFAIHEIFVLDLQCNKILRKSFVLSFYLTVGAGWTDNQMNLVDK